ncbi:MAG: hypothetical protein LBF66_00825 [Holosporales bacterium]|nr:hypothetical protein [Holosporales bacterium]
MWSRGGRLASIHIPSDVPGLLRAQGIETSAFVPRSVSREPIYLSVAIKLPFAPLISFLLVLRC